MDMTLWHGVYAPAKTPKRIIDTFSNVLQRVLKDPEMLAKFREIGNEINPAVPKNRRPSRNRNASVIRRSSRPSV